jgi:hypothetical protein
MMGVAANEWAVLAGDAMAEERGLELDLADEASLCLVYSNNPSGDLFGTQFPCFTGTKVQILTLLLLLLANEAMLKSPFAEEFTKQIHNAGGGANLAGGNYPMMFADIKSAVMKATRGRQMPWTSIVPQDADKVRRLCVGGLGSAVACFSSGTSTKAGHEGCWCVSCCCCVTGLARVVVCFT